jgi:CRISPR-associated exonuclease Cas4
VEFAPDGTPYPVEYKHGSRHKAAEISSCDDLQLGAQAICLEYMLNREVLAGAVFYAASKRRREVRIDDALRERVERATLEVRRMLEARLLAFPTSDVRRCRECSLRDDCQPESARPGTLDSALSRLFIPDQ